MTLTSTLNLIFVAYDIKLNEMLQRLVKEAHTSDVF